LSCMIFGGKKCYFCILDNFDRKKVVLWFSVGIIISYFVQSQSSFKIKYNTTKVVISFIFNRPNTPVCGNYFTQFNTIEYINRRKIIKRI
jgi:hypothetical protein